MNSDIEKMIQLAASMREFKASLTTAQKALGLKQLIELDKWIQVVDETRENMQMEWSK